MRNKVVVLGMTGVLLLLGISGMAYSQLPGLPAESEVPLDTSEIMFDYTTAYPGTEGMWLTVMLRNREPVLGCSLNVMIYAPNLDTNFATFSHDDTGGCFIDTTGCLTGIWGMPKRCKCIDEPCRFAYVLYPWWGIPPIPEHWDRPYPFFKIQTDICCIPDSTDYYWRWALLDVHGLLMGEYGPVPLIPYPSNLDIWWSVPGDANGDSLVNTGDVVFLINYLFMGGPEPCVCEAADCNNDSTINTGDVVYLINYLFIDGPAPLPGSVHCPHEDCWPK